MKISSLSLLFLVSIVGSVLHGQAEGLLPMAKPEAVGLDPKKLEAVDKKMEALIEDNRLTGGAVVIARKGKVAHFETYGLRNREEELPVEKDTIFRIYSMTKAITSMAALMLSEEEKLDLDDPLSKFFPPLKKMKVWKDGNLIDTVREATVADLLRHTSGLTYGWMSNKPIREALRSAVNSQD